nr:brain type fatty acid binding protein [Hymenolepis microstoma]
MEPFIGCWKYQTHENFDKFLNCVGVPYLISKIAVRMPASLTFSRTENPDEYKTELSTITKTTGGIFKVGEGFQESTMRGGFMDSKIWFEEGVMKQEQNTDKGLVQTTRKVEGDTMFVTYNVGNIKSSQTYKKTS